MKRRIWAVLTAMMVMCVSFAASCFAEEAEYTPDDVIALLNEVLPEETDLEGTEYYASADETATACYVYCVSDAIAENAAAAEEGGAMEAWQADKVDAYRKYTLMRETVDECGYDTAIVQFMYGAFPEEETDANAETVRDASQIAAYYTISDLDGRDTLTISDSITQDTAPAIADGATFVNGTGSFGAAETEEAEVETTYVWVSKSGKKYHSTSTCSNMKNPSEVTEQEAISRGLEPCSKCW